MAATEAVNRTKELSSVTVAQASSIHLIITHVTDVIPLQVFTNKLMKKHDVHKLAQDETARVS